MLSRKISTSVNYFCELKWLIVTGFLLMVHLCIGQEVNFIFSVLYNLNDSYYRFSDIFKPVYMLVATVDYLFKIDLFE